MKEETGKAESSSDNGWKRGQMKNYVKRQNRMVND